jgi:glycosyltransferase involved in cell wall biosynthesis
MRVLMTNPHATGGLATYTGGLCRGLADNGAQVELLAAEGFDSRPWGDSFRVNRLLRPMAPKKFSGRLSWAVDRGYTALFNSWTQSRQALSASADVVHYQGLIPPTDQFFLGRVRARRPLVHTVHDTVPHGESFVENSGFLRRCYRSFDRLIVHYSGGAGNLIERYGVRPERISVIPHGADVREGTATRAEARARLALPAERRILLFFGAIRPEKGLGILLQALSSAKRKNPELFLVIAGNPPRGASFDSYRAQIERLGLAADVKVFLRFVEEEEIGDFFAACDLCVLPYERFDSQSGVLMQAYVHSRPALVSDLGAMGELVRADGIGLAVPPSDVEALAEAIGRMIGGYEGYSSRCGPRTAEKYSWGSVGKLTLDCYRLAVDGR